MKKGIYIHYGSKIELAGVEKKIQSQIKIMSTAFDVENVLIEKEKTNLVKSIMWRFPFGSWGIEYSNALNEIEKINKEQSIDFIYIRKPLFDRKSVNFLKKIRIKYEKAKIIMEIPTYPYYKELISSKTMWPWYFKDIIYKSSLEKYIDRICTFSDEKKIFNIQTINICNGICVEEFHEQNISARKEDCVNLLAVAQFQKSHGYERIIKGLYNYYKEKKTKKRVVIHMVGYGEELAYYKKLVTKYELHDYVIFYGKKTGKELDEIFNNADIGMGCFGLYKRKIKTISSLKVGEYLARGIPVVSGVHEKVFEKEACDYYIEFPNDNSEVSIDEIVSFYERLYETEEKLQNKIREYAKRNVDMSITMKPVIDYINDCI